MPKKTKDGRAKISLMIPSIDRDIEVRLEGAFSYSTKLCDTIRTIPGVIEVVENVYRVYCNDVILIIQQHKDATNIISALWNNFKNS